VIRRIEFPKGPPAHPLLNALLVAGGALVFAALVLFSLLAFLVVTSLVALLAGVVGLRAWWHGRKRRRFAPPERTEPGQVIEGEYRQVSGREDEGQGGS
jgi:hypothetical protein